MAGQQCHHGPDEVPPALLGAELHDAVEVDESTVAAGGVVTVGSHVDLTREDGEEWIGLGP